MKLGGCVYIQALVRGTEVIDDVMQYVWLQTFAKFIKSGCDRKILFGN
jgi:hypothetical protein